jgi:hypothetical protein
LPSTHSVKHQNERKKRHIYHKFHNKTDCQEHPLFIIGRAKKSAPQKLITAPKDKLDHLPDADKEKDNAFNGIPKHHLSPVTLIRKSTIADMSAAPTSPKTAALSQNHHSGTSSDHGGQYLVFIFRSLE